MDNCLGNMKVDVVEARNLTNMDGLFGKNDAYVIVKVNKQKHKTNIIAKGGKNPVWNETFHFTINEGDEIVFEVYDYDKIKDDHIGSIKIPLTQQIMSQDCESWYALTRGAKNGGELLVRLHFQLKGQYPQGANVPQ